MRPLYGYFLTKDEARHRRALRSLILAFFKEPRRSFGMHKDPFFDGYDEKEIREMQHAMIRVGLLRNANGKPTRQALYATTKDGLKLLDE